MRRFLGIDNSLNHGALVLLGEGGDAPIDWHVYSDKPGVVKKAAPNASRLVNEKGDPQLKDIARLDYIDGVFNAQLSRMAPDYVAIEGYAFDASGRAYQLGEGGGCARLAVWRRDIPLRLHDPTCVKMYAAWNGNADKIEVCKSVRERWGQDWGHFDDLTEGDLADAYTLARLARVEWQLREGHIKLSDLEHDKERQVFLRTTQAVPTNILGREWLLRP